ncbi:MAG: T9SS type A sorting domain-containing protein [Bacteroidales bacterium]|nr:T9SS type A sorting domain-containing protein [Bacteroidales bacterium]
MRKLFLSLVAVLLCGVTFAQTITVTQENFVSALTANPSGNFIQEGNIVLGALTAPILEDFQGTYNGNNNTITYSGTFATTTNGDKIGLFKSVSGTITNLNIDANITVSGNNSQVNIGLLCGQLANGGTIEFCDVVGNVNSTAKSGGIGNASTGLIIGSNLGTLQYCTGHGNVTGIGFVGGLVGSMGTVLGNFTQATTGTIKGCYFTGNVTAVNSSSLDGYQSFGGGICGYMTPGAKIELCIAEAIIVTGENARGITSVGTSFSVLAGYKPKIHDTYCSGTINGSTVDSDGECVNNITILNMDLVDNKNTYNPGTDIANCQGTHAECIVDALEDARCPDETDEDNCDNNFYFEVINGKVVLVVGQPVVTPTYICEAPINLTVSVGNFNEERTERDFTASWTPNNQDDSVNENTFRYTLTNDGDTIHTGTTTNTTASGTLPTAATPYKLTIESDCSASQNDLYSDAISYTFYVDANCEAVSALQVTGVTTTTANVSWTGTANVVKLNGEVIELTSGQTLTGLTPATEYTIEAIVNCTRHEGETEIPYELSTSVTFVTDATKYVTAQTGNFNSPSTWVGGRVPDGDAETTITIRNGHKVRLDGTLVLRGTIINEGILVIPQQGQLINKTNVNVPGIVEIESDNKTVEAWTFVGAPFEDYTFGAVVPTSEDVAMIQYDYSQGKWSDAWAHYHDAVDTAEGVFAWPFYGGAITFSTYNFGASTSSTYPANATATYALNNGEVTVTQSTLQNTADGYWMALANPYPAKLDVNSFINTNSSRLQGGVTYKFNGTSFDIQSATTGEILMTEGFFVNFKANAVKKVVFQKEQLKDWNGATNVNNKQAKSSANEFIELTLQNGDEKVRVYFAHNEDAEQGYDIFDANKMFATTGVAEPYFVTDGIALIKEEVAELPYYATMNVRSQEDTVMNFVLTNLPEGYAVSIIDGEEVIDLVEGGVYSTEILTGENADRFKVLVKKNVGIADVEELDVTITNNNRHITIAAQEDVKVTVYNTLGQRVFETEKTDFVLSGVASGAYVVKVQGAKAAKSQKIIVE